MMMEELVLKYIRGEASLQEREQVLSWVGQSEANRLFYIEQKKAYIRENFPNAEASSKDVMEFKRRLQSQIDLASAGNLFLRWAMRAAAVLFLPLALFAGYLAFDKYNAQQAGLVSNLADYVQVDSSAILTYHTNAGVKGLVELPDGSSVILNSSSKIRVPSKFNRESRVVELEGEGYFTVASDSTWPMFVNTTKGVSVKVLGTTFNLSSYENDPELKFTLISGRVKLLSHNSGQEIDVHPFQEVVIPDNHKQKGVKRVANVELNTAWKDGFLVFEDAALSEVIRKLERWYGATIVVPNRKILDNRFTASFSSESLSQVLEFLRLSTNIGYTLSESNKVVLSQVDR